MTITSNDITIIHSTGTRTPIFCITDLKYYPSAVETAKAYNVSPGMISWVVTGRAKTCKGKRFCRVSDMPYYAQEIAEVASMVHGKATKYDAIKAEEERIKAEQEAARRAEEERIRAKQRAQEKLEKCKAEYNKKLAALHEAERLLQESEDAAKALEGATN